VVPGLTLSERPILAPIEHQRVGPIGEAEVHHPADRDGRVVITESLFQCAVDHPDGIGEDWRAGCEGLPAVRLETITAFQWAAAAEVVGECLILAVQVVDGEMPAVQDRRAGLRAVVDGNSMDGGSAVRCVADNARNPAGPSTPCAVTTATPTARAPRARQKVLPSIADAGWLSDVLLISSLDLPDDCRNRDGDSRRL